MRTTPNHQLDIKLIQPCWRETDQSFLARRHLAFMRPIIDLLCSAFAGCLTYPESAASSAHVIADVPLRGRFSFRFVDLVSLPLFLTASHPWGR